VPVWTTARDASPEERSIIARRMELRRKAARSVRGDGRWLGPVFGVAAAAVGAWLLEAPSPPLGIGFAMTLTFSVMGFVAARRDRKRIAEDLRQIDALEATLARAVTEHRIAADRIVVASEDEGDYEVWWFFRDAVDHTWLVLQDGQWTDLDASTRTWHRDIRVAVDSQCQVVSIASAGPPLGVERRDLQPPDYLPTPTTLFWKPPETLGPRLPAVIAQDPTKDPTAVSGT